MSTRTHRCAHRAQAGVTLMEVIIVLAIMSLVWALGTGLVKTKETRLREETAKVIGALQGAYNLAMETGVHHRVVFDLEEQGFQIEVCEGEMKLRASEEEELPDPEEIERLSELAEQPVTSDFNTEMLQAVSPEAAVEVAAALANVNIGSARCVPATKFAGTSSGKNQHLLPDKHGIRISEIHVQHLREPASEGIATINFFPTGYAEKAVVQMVNDDDDSFAVVVHGMTGRIEFRGGDFDPEKHMMRDCAGEDVEER